MSEQFKSIETTELIKIANAIRTKTGTTDKISLEDMPAKIAAIEGGVALPELENEGAAADLLSGKELIDDEGNVVTGTFSIDNELSAQSTLLSEQDAKIAELAEILAGKASGGVSGVKTASVYVDTTMGTTFRYIGIDGLVTISNTSTTVEMVVPSICMAQSHTIFGNFSVSGDCLQLWNNLIVATVYVTGDANIYATSGSGGGA